MLKIIKIYKFKFRQMLTMIQLTNFIMIKSYLRILNKKKSKKLILKSNMIRSLFKIIKNNLLWGLFKRDQIRMILKLVWKHRLFFNR